MAQRASKKPPSFEERLEALETVVEALEGDELTLEVSLERYREGVEHLRACRELLDAAIFSKIFDAHSRYMKYDERTFISPHRGFDLNRLIMKLSSIGSVREVVRSPFPFLPRVLNQTVLFSFVIKERDASKIEDTVIQASQ